ncbi:MAG: caspase family protein [Myxococcaceae bacterium]
MTGLLLLLALVTSAEPPRKAVVVGSNAAIDGRSSLHFAHRDARSLAEVLQSSGGFAAGDVTLLLDAKPEAVLAALDAARAELAKAPEHGLLLFYYSGHADQASLYPGGAPLPLERLKERLADEGVGVRVGIIDACRGGGWTQAKGLTATAPFEVGVPALSSEGTALLAASSGLEDAHEAEALQGSFFTHYLVAGLRGAADATGDGQVTLSEAFAYANRLTIRDTATRSKIPQHPSFDLRLRGRQDVVLTSVGGEDTQLVVAQKEGPLEVVQLSTGVTVAEASPGEQLLRLALPPGPYLVRRLKDGVVLSREVVVRANEATRLEESALTLVGQQALVSKGPSPALGGRNELAASFASGPFDPYFVSLGPAVDFTWFFSRFLGWRVLGGTVFGNLDRGLKAQLERDFGVLPTAFATPRATAHTAFVFEPTLVATGSFVLRAGLFVGPGLSVHEYPLSSGTRYPLYPAVVFGGELTFMFASLFDAVGLGVRLSGSDVMRFGAELLMPAHLVTLNLGLVVDLGQAR